MAAPPTTSALAPEVEHSHAIVNEPSMEDILASIRRIIAEDQSNNVGRSGLGGLTRRQSSASSAPVAHEAPAAHEEVPAPHAEEAPVAQGSVEPELHAEPEEYRLQHEYEAPADVSHVPSQDAMAAEPDAAPFETSHAGEAAHHVYDHPVDDQHPQSGLPMADEGVEPLMSPVAGASITSSFQTLAESVMLQDPGLIERVMRESMRPLLKAWLDDHLPSIVERLVRTEIERVARGGRARSA